MCFLSEQPTETFFSSLKFFMQLRSLICRRMSLCVQRPHDSLCMSVFVSLQDTALSNVPLISCSDEKGEIVDSLCVEKNILPPSMCHYVTLKMWRQSKNVTFDSADWSWLLYNQWTHRQHMLAVQDPLCVSACVITTHLFYIEALLHQRMLVELQFTSRTLCLVNVAREFFSLTHDATRVVVIHQRK